MRWTGNRGVGFPGQAAGKRKPGWRFMGESAVPGPRKYCPDLPMVLRSEALNTTMDQTLAERVLDRG